VTLVLSIAAVLLVVKTTLLEAFRVGGVLPDVFLVLVVYASLFRGPRGGLVAGGLAGFLVALASPSEKAATYPLIYGLGGWFAGIAWGPIMRRSFPTEFLILLLLGALVDTIFLIEEAGMSRSLFWGVPIIVLPSAIATALTGPLLFAGMARVLESMRLGAFLRVRERR
jgi:hypothetical protein